MNTSAPMSCRVCGHATAHVRDDRLLGRHVVGYHECPNCGYFQTSTPHWLDEAYASAINDVDTGIFYRNLLNVRRVLMTLASLGRLQGKVVDHAGGYGILVRLLRDVGVDATWRDKYCENLHARGFEAHGEGHDLLTAFEVFEHLESPLDELRLMLADAPAVLLSTELIPGDQTPAPDWWYLGQEHGQHIGFFRARTLAWMARQLGCHHASDGVSLHLFTRGPVPRHWALLQKLRRFAPRVAAMRLTSRTISDFEQLRTGRR